MAPLTSLKPEAVRVGLLTPPHTAPGSAPPAPTEPGAGSGARNETMTVVGSYLWSRHGNKKTTELLLCSETQV